jgi:NMD protein affecting ribosome stability and mRNA decay
MKPLRKTSQAALQGRRNAGRAQSDHILDPYQSQQKLQEPTACQQCGAVYHHGRWQWGQEPAGAQQDLCPACRRINDRLPAGSVTLHGEWARQHKDEFLGLARNEEVAEKGEHPLNRIIGVEETADGLVISTTDIHLPRRIGEALRRAFDGELDMHFDDAAYFVRVDWRAPG